MKAFQILVGFPLFVSTLAKMCECPCPPDGEKLRDLINCFTEPWGYDDFAHDQGNSKTTGCNDTNINYCRATNSEDLFCKFDGINTNLQPTKNKPKCYFNCGTHTCDAFEVAHDEHQLKCIKNFFKDK